MTPRYPTAEVLFYTSRTLRPVHLGMSLADLCTPDAVEDELAAGRNVDGQRVEDDVAAVIDKLPHNVPVFRLLEDTETLEMLN